MVRLPQFGISEFARAPGLLMQIHQAFLAGTPRAVLVSQLVWPEALEDFRVALTSHWQPFAIADRGRYELADLALDTVGPLHAWCETITVRSLAVTRVRALRFSHESYQLTRDDQFDQMQLGLLQEPSVELDLDFSSTITGEADVTFANNQTAPVLSVPQMPNTAVLVERAPQALHRWVKYLSYRVQTRQVYRLRVVMKYVG